MNGKPGPAVLEAQHEPEIAEREVEVPAPTQRFVQDVIRLHERLRFSGLPDSVDGDPVHHHESGDGLITIGVRTSQLPHRYVLGIYGFRLAQYMRLGFVCRRLAHRHALFHEPLPPTIGVDDVHVLTLCARTGRITGYAGLAGARDPAPLPLDAPHRTRRSVERDHHVDLLSCYAAEGWTTHDVFEAKRLVRDQAMPRGDLAARVPWHLLMGWGRCLLALGGPRRRVLVVGDAKESGSLRHLRAMGLDLTVVEGTAPSLPRSDLLWPIFETAEQAKPFVGRLPATFAEDMTVIEAFLAEPVGAAPVGALLTRLAARGDTRQHKGKRGTG